MTLHACYIGQPMLARGWLLTGVKAVCPEPTAGAVWSALETAHAEAGLVLLDAALAQLVEARLEQMLERKPLPPVLLVGAMDTGDPPARDTVEMARRELGISHP